MDVGYRSPTEETPMPHLEHAYNKMLLAWFDSAMWRLDHEWQTLLVEECPDLFESEAGLS